eukprot:3851602-Prorocentrum_lima.AAC.1
MGDFKGGLLWVGSKAGRILPPHTATGLGPYIKGRSHVAKGKWLDLDGTEWHAVTPTKGFRLSW